MKLTNMLLSTSLILPLTILRAEVPNDDLGGLKQKLVFERDKSQKVASEEQASLDQKPEYGDFLNNTRCDLPDANENSVPKNDLNERLDQGMTDDEILERDLRTAMIKVDQAKEMNCKSNESIF